MRSITIAAATAVFGALGALGLVQQTTKSGMQQPSSTPVPSDAIVQGCWGSSGELTFVKKIKYNSRDSCGVQTCQKLNHTVGATYRGDECWCGSKYPPKSTLVSDDDCNVICPGFGWDACGGANAWTVYNSGIDLYGVEFAADPSSSSVSSITATPTLATAASGASSTGTGDESSGGGSNTAGIAAGVVVSIVAVAGIGGGIWFWLRRKRNHEIEEEHRRTAAVNAFINGNKPPGSSGSMSMTDSRMDPVLAQRRMSDGSIADNQDYSRRILRVTNA